MWTQTGEGLLSVNRELLIRAQCFSHFYSTTLSRRWQEEAGCGAEEEVTTFHILFCVDLASGLVKGQEPGSLGAEVPLCDSVIH